jgi:hypothetical protein
VRIRAQPPDPAHNGSTERSIQLDPTTRTGWTYAPGGDEVEQFSY